MSVGRLTAAIELGLAWQEVVDALPKGAWIATTEHPEYQIAFAAVRVDVRNRLDYEGKPDDEVIAWGAGDTPASALRDLTQRLQEQAKP